MIFRRECCVAATILSAISGSIVADDAVTFQYKAAKGDRSVYRAVAELKQKVEFQNVRLESSKTQDEVVTQAVESVGDEGKLNLTTKNERLKVTAAYGPNEKYEFDSKETAHDKGSVIGGALTPVNERLAGSQFSFTVGPRGSIVEVKGFKEIVAEAMKDNSLAVQFSVASTDEETRFNLQDRFVVFQDKGVKPGEKWDVPYDLEIPNYGKATGKVTYTYDGPDKVGDRKTVKFSVTSDISFDMKMDLSGIKITGTYSTRNSSGTIQFDPQAGKVVSVRREVTMGGQLSVNDDGMIIPVQNEETQTVKIDLLDKVPE